MSRYLIQPSRLEHGDIVVPGDKSISHRALMLGAHRRGRRRASPGFSRARTVWRRCRPCVQLGVTVAGPTGGDVTVTGVGLHGLHGASGCARHGQRRHRDAVVHGTAERAVVRFRAASATRRSCGARWSASRNRCARWVRGSRLATAVRPCRSTAVRELQRHPLRDAGRERPGQVRGAAGGSVRSRRDRRRRARRHARSHRAHAANVRLRRRACATARHVCSRRGGSRPRRSSCPATSRRRRSGSLPRASVRPGRSSCAASASTRRAPVCSRCWR